MADRTGPVHVSIPLGEVLLGAGFPSLAQVLPLGRVLDGVGFTAVAHTLRLASMLHDAGFTATAESLVQAANEAVEQAVGTPFDIDMATKQPPTRSPALLRALP